MDDSMAILQGMQFFKITLLLYLCIVRAEGVYDNV